MFLLPLFCVCTFVVVSSNGASIVAHFSTYTEESPTKSLVVGKKLGLNLLNKNDQIKTDKKERTPRIYNGREASIAEFPWMVSVQRSDDTMMTHVCGGSIISPRHILSAAHCFVPRNGRMYNILAGSQSNNYNNSEGQLIRVQKIITHPHYKSSPTSHDIAILILEREIEINNLTTEVISLPSKEHLYGDVNAKAAGWGSTRGIPPYEKNGRITTSTTISPAVSIDGDLSGSDFGYAMTSHTLKATNLTIFNTTECNEWHHPTRKLDKYLMCAGASNMTEDVDPGDTRSGDSGGPLFMKQNGKWVIVGITSITYAVDYRLLPTLYTRVSEYVCWIQIHLHEGWIC